MAEDDGEAWLPDGIVKRRVIHETVDLICVRGARCGRAMRRRVLDGGLLEREVGVHGVRVDVEYALEALGVEGRVGQPGGPSEGVGRTGVGVGGAGLGEVVVGDGEGGDDVHDPAEEGGDGDREPDGLHVGAGGGEDM